jgi:hypothetical protein
MLGLMANGREGSMKMNFIKLALKAGIQAPAEAAKPLPVRRKRIIPSIQNTTWIPKLKELPSRSFL